MSATSILIVEDEALIAKTLARKLKRLGYIVNAIVSSSDAAIKEVNEQQPDLILMDIAIKGDRDGIETATIIQEDFHIPVVYLTAYADEGTIERASQTTCYGYLLKPFKEKELHATLTMAMSQHRRMESSRKQVDVPEVEDSQDVYSDPLTGFPNQLVLRDHFQKLISQRNEDSETENSIALVCLNLDRFKRINESVGDAVGDLLIKDVSKRLVSSTSPHDAFIVRCNNQDEFILLFLLDRCLDSVPNITQRLLREIHYPFHVGEHEVILTASAGLSFYPEHGNDIEQLVLNGKEAVNYAKSQGKNRLEIFQPSTKATPPNQLSLETDLYHALERDELQLYYQPQVDLRTGEIVGAEALLRWIHPERKFVSPGVFIPIAEETGLIEPIGDWIIDQACQFIRELNKLKCKTPRIAVNLSGQQFKQPDLLDNVRKYVNRWAINPDLLELEVTEQILVENVEDTQVKLNSFRDLGIKIAIDDFGTGYSSLGYLQRFPFDILKIDRCFVQDINEQPKNEAIVNAIIDMAGHLNLTVIAEGIETEAELEVLKGLNCDMMQGYLFCNPLPKKDFTEFLLEKSQLKCDLMKA